MTPHYFTKKDFSWQMPNSLLIRYFRKGVVLIPASSLLILQVPPQDENDA